MKNWKLLATNSDFVTYEITSHFAVYLVVVSFLAVSINRAIASKTQFEIRNNEKSLNGELNNI